MKNLLLVCTLTLLLGCATPSKVVNVGGFDGTDIIKVPSGATIHIPAGSKIVYSGKDNVVTWAKDTDIVTTKSGRFMSDQVLKDIIDSK